MKPEQLQLRPTGKTQLSEALDIRHGYSASLMSEAHDLRIHGWIIHKLP